MAKYEDIELAIQEVKQVFELFLHRQNLRELSSQIGELIHLLKLSLNYNRLRSLPSSLENLQNLNHLEIAHNQFREFPLVICKLNHLRLLDLRHNQLQNLPEEICQLKNIEMLNLRGNNLETLPQSLALLPKLHEINLQGNRNLDLENVVEVLAQHPILFQLNLSLCNIQRLPDNFHKLQNLQSLQLIDNTELELKDTFDKLSPLENLRILNVYNTQRHLPQNIANLQQLTHFTFHRFKLDEVHLSKLSNLSYLDASYNRLEQIPHWIFKLPQLHTLILKSNKIRHIPSKINQLQNLRHLDLRHNHLQDLPKYLAPLLAELEHFLLEGNRDIPHKNVQKFLKQIAQKVKHSQIKVLAASLFLGDLEKVSQEADKTDLFPILNLNLSHVVKYTLAALEHLLPTNPLQNLQANDLVFFAGSSKRYTLPEARQSLKKLGIKTSTRYHSKVSYIILGKNPGKKIEILPSSECTLATDKHLCDWMQAQKNQANFSLSEMNKLRSMLGSQDMSNVSIACQLIMGRGLSDELLEDMLALYLFAPQLSLKKIAQEIVYKYFPADLQALIEQIESFRPELKIKHILNKTYINPVSFINKVYHLSGNGQKQIIELGGEYFEEVIKTQMNYSNILSLRFNLKNISPQIETLKYIKKIEIIGSPQDPPVLREIPSVIYKLRQLEYLRIDETNLEKVSPEIGNLVNLTKLRLADSRIDLLPPSIGNLKNLKILSVFNNYLKALPEELGELLHLRELWAFSNQITELPISIGKLRKLKHLHLSSNYISSLPKEIGGLLELEELSLSGNPIEYIPPEIANLKNLRRLEFGRKNRLDQETKLYLIKHLPQCRITFYK